MFPRENFNFYSIFLNSFIKEINEVMIQRLKMDKEEVFNLKTSGYLSLKIIFKNLLLFLITFMFHLIFRKGIQIMESSRIPHIIAV
jgi:hypothetical protein